MKVLALLALITIAGGALRWDAAHSPSAYQSVDERAYARLARNLARHAHYGDKQMSDPVRWPPGAPAMFALAHELRPRITEGERWDVPSAYPLQVAFGTALVPAVFALAFLLAGPAAGIVSAAAIAFYPPLISASGDLLTEPLGALMLVTALIAVVLALQRESWRWSIAAGALLGLAVLVRADLLFLPFVLAALLAIVTRRPKHALALAATAAATLAPWSVYASGETGTFTPVSSGGASNLFVGTYVPGDGTMFGLKRKLGFTPTTPQKKVMDAVARRRPGLKRDAAIRAEAFDNVEDHVVGDPLAFTGMAIRKVDRLWLGYSVGTHRNERTAILAYHLLLVGTCLLGLAAGLIRRREKALWIPATAALYVTAINVVLVSEPRHNLPFMPVLVAGGVAGIALAVQRWPRFTAAIREKGTLSTRS